MADTYSETAEQESAINMLLLYFSPPSENATINVYVSRLTVNKYGALHKGAPSAVILHSKYTCIQCMDNVLVANLS